MVYTRYYCIGVAARELKCSVHDVMRLINSGVIEADADLSGAALVIAEGEVEKAKEALKGKYEPVLR